jgi:hypothetical protein
MLLKPWLAPLVILFWFVTTGWLVVEKIVPFFSTGSPPGYEALAVADGRAIPVAWTVMWNEEPVGWAVSRARLDRDGVARVRSRLKLDRIPIADVLPKWSKLLLRDLPASAKLLSIEADGSLLIGEGGAVRSFRSDLRLPTVGQSISLAGDVQGEKVSASIRSGDLRYDVTRTVPSAVRLGDELSPMATMPGLHVGKRWTLPIYSPLKLGGSPIELLHARVGGEETMFWEDQLVRALIVAYRDDPSPRREPRFRLWVDRGGRVLRQESSVMGVEVAFVRRSDEAAEALARSLDAESGFDVELDCPCASTSDPGSGCHQDPSAVGPRSEAAPQAVDDPAGHRRPPAATAFETSWAAWLADQLPLDLFVEQPRQEGASAPSIGPGGSVRAGRFPEGPAAMAEERRP